MSKNKTLYKYEFANKLGVSLKTFGRWIEPYRDDLEKLGVKRKGQLLTPGAVKYLCKVFCVDLDEYRRMLDNVRQCWTLLDIVGHCWTVTFSDFVPLQTTTGDEP